MPWYTDPDKACKVLNKIANRYSHTTLHDLKSVLDHVSALLWEKQEHYYEDRRHR